MADLQNSELARLKISQIFGPEPPFDFRVASQSACARAGRVDQHTVEEGCQSEARERP